MKKILNLPKPRYQFPEIVEVGSVSQLTHGMGGCSHDMAGWTIVVKPNGSDDDVPSTNIWNLDIWNEA